MLALCGAGGESVPKSLRQLGLSYWQETQDIGKAQIHPSFSALTVMIYRIGQLTSKSGVSVHSHRRFRMANLLGRNRRPPACPQLFKGECASSRPSAVPETRAIGADMMPVLAYSAPAISSVCSAGRLCQSAPRLAVGYDDHGQLLPCVRFFSCTRHIGNDVALLFRRGGQIPAQTQGLKFSSISEAQFRPGMVALVHR